MTARIAHTTTSGTFSLDGQTFDVDNNVWVIGDNTECVVIDAPHDVPAIQKVVDGRRVVAILATHGHDDHVRAAPALSEAVGAPVLLHPDDHVLWRITHPGGQPDGELRDGQEIHVTGITLHVLHTPGHAPGAVCFDVPELDAVFTGDTLFAGGPGATGRSYSDFDVILRSISEKLFALPDTRVVHPGHGATTTIGTEKPHLEKQIAETCGRLLRPATLELGGKSAAIVLDDADLDLAEIGQSATSPSASAPPRPGSARLGYGPGRVRHPHLRRQEPEVPA
ncbi:aldehyde dehydrogenase family protein [Saccharopolyspora sp. NPDC050389]|uniref:MBL fold metallo-hydrolase n=1 Tax=Saccharopolyspora sp. NPDC050389 TaxID=3155516 RepID=UPI0033FF3216